MGKAIINNTKIQSNTDFARLDIGEFFMFDEDLYIKVENSKCKRNANDGYGDYDYEYNAIALNDLEKVYFVDSMNVLSVNVEISIIGVSKC